MSTNPPTGRDGFPKVEDAITSIIDIESIVSDDGLSSSTQRVKTSIIPIWTGNAWVYDRVVQIETDGGPVTEQREMLSGEQLEQWFRQSRGGGSVVVYGQDLTRRFRREEGRER